MRPMSAAQPAAQAGFQAGLRQSRKPMRGVFCGNGTNCSGTQLLRSTTKRPDCRKKGPSPAVPAATQASFDTYKTSAYVHLYG